MAVVFFLPPMHPTTMPCGNGFPFGIVAGWFSCTCFRHRSGVKEYTGRFFLPLDCLHYFLHTKKQQSIYKITALLFYLFHCNRFIPAAVPHPPVFVLPPMTSRNSRQFLSMIIYQFQLILMQFPFFHLLSCLPLLYTS